MKLIFFDGNIDDDSCYGIYLVKLWHSKLAKQYIYI